MQLLRKRTLRSSNESKAQLSEDMVDEDEFAIIKMDHDIKKNYREWKDDYERLKVRKRPILLP